MKKTVAALSFVLTLSFSGLAHAAVHTGVDQNGNACSVSLENLRYGKTVMHSSCDFDMDGVGPWCNTQKDVPTEEVTGDGEFQTASGSTTFKIEEKMVRYTDPSYSFSGQSPDGGYVDVTIANGNQVTVSGDFYTAYGKTLTGDQIRQALDQARGVNYQQVLDSIYITETCTIQL